MERTISGMMGKGSVSHNTRTFSAKNVDKERSGDNVEFCHTPIKEVYHTLFDDALERYNAKQKRSDRKIDDYYEKIRRGKQEKLFHEAVFQIGNKDDTNARSEEGQLAKEILTEFVADFQKRNPNLYVFSAHLHMDEETPHVHIDFVPFIRGSSRGLDTRVSLKGALAEQGFQGGTRGMTEWNQWMEAEKQTLANVAERYGVRWKHLGTHNKHLSVLDFEKQERAKEVANLERRKITLRQDVEKMADSKAALERSVHAYDEKEKWQLAEAPALMSARTYREKNAAPLVARLKTEAKNLTLQCAMLKEQLDRQKAKTAQHAERIDSLRGRLRQQSEELERLRERADDFERVKRCVGAERVDAIVAKARETERVVKNTKQYHTVRGTGR